MRCGSSPCQDDTDAAPNVARSWDEPQSGGTKTTRCGCWIARMCPLIAAGTPPFSPSGVMRIALKIVQEAENEETLALHSAAHVRGGHARRPRCWRRAAREPALVRSEAPCGR